MEQGLRRVTLAIEASRHARASPSCTQRPKILGLVALVLVHSIDGLLRASALLAPGVLAYPSSEEECVQLVLGYLNSTSRISTWRTPLGALISHRSPTSRPIRALAMGLEYEILLVLISDSSSPTI